MSEQDRKSPERKEDFEVSGPPNGTSGGNDFSAERKDRPAELHFPAPETSGDERPSGDENDLHVEQRTSDERAPENEQLHEDVAGEQSIYNVPSASDGEEPTENEVQSAPSEESSAAESHIEDETHEADSVGTAAPAVPGEEPLSEEHTSGYSDKEMLQPSLEQIPEETSEQTLSADAEGGQPASEIGSPTPGDVHQSAEEAGHRDLHEDTAAPEESPSLSDEEEEVSEEYRAIENQEQPQTSEETAEPEIHDEHSGEPDAIDAGENPAAEEPEDIPEKGSSQASEEPEPAQEENHAQSIEGLNEGEGNTEVPEEAAAANEMAPDRDEAGDSSSSDQEAAREVVPSIPGAVIPPAVVSSGPPAARAPEESGLEDGASPAGTASSEGNSRVGSSEAGEEGDAGGEMAGNSDENEAEQRHEEPAAEAASESDQPEEVAKEEQQKKAETEPVADLDDEPGRNEAPEEASGEGAEVEQGNVGEENPDKVAASVPESEVSPLNGLEEIVNEENGGAGEPEVREEVVDDLAHIIESIVFASDEPLPVATIKSVLDAAHIFGRVNPDMITSRVSALNAKYEADGTGFHIVEIANGYQYATRKEMAQWVSNLFKERSKRRLSNSALETVAIIAYKQPITKPEIESIRGVNVDYVLHALLEKELVTVVGRAETVGRPLLYGTTQKFLKVFALKSLDDLPKLREIEEIIKEIRSKGAEESIQLEITALGDSSSPEPTTDSETNPGATTDNGAQ